ncbi:MAG: PH domain-containing protein [Vallitaleaceae bacterium]|nr:PH domain-containing protein [Vallitaleaceae bacterium]
MKTILYERVDPKSRLLWMINGFIFSVFLMAALVVVSLLVIKVIWPILIGIVLCLYITLVSPFYEYKQWKYAAESDRVEIIHGIFIVKRTVVPINRIQHINIKQGVIQKKLGLSSVEIFTSGGQHSIEGLNISVAGLMADRLNALVVLEEMEYDPN